MCTSRPKAPSAPAPPPPLPQPLQQPDAFAARLSATNRLPGVRGGVPQSTLLTPVQTGTTALGGQ